MSQAKRPNRIKDLTNKRFGKLVVLNFNSISKSKHSIWECKCDCGNKCLSYSTNLIRGVASSCGCIKKSVLGKNTTKHGLSKTRIFKIWAGVRKRCLNEKCQSYHNYGGRGIKICERWNDFYNFYNDMINGYSDELTLDRIDPNGDYTPSNCRWVNHQAQANNRRNNVFICFNGETKTIAQWSNITGVRRNAISYRIKHGWDLKDALFNTTNNNLKTINDISKYLVF